MLLPILALASLAFWFWSIGAIAEHESPTVRLQVEVQGVQVKAPGSDQWQDATNGMEVGRDWSVKTDATGLAVIRFYDQGESRLSHDTSITIQQAEVDADRPGSAQVDVKIDFGRIWSRVLKFFDLEGSYSIQTPSVVATVRGTAFDVSVSEDGDTKVLVDESVVSVASANSVSSVKTLVPEGIVASFGSTGTLSSTSTATLRTGVDEWILRNQLADEAYMEEMYTLRVNMLKRGGGVDLDSSLSGIAGLSEQLHILLAKEDQKDVLAERYLTRRILRLIELVEAGKTGLAAQEFSRLESYIKTQLQGENADRERERIHNTLARITFLVEGANPDDPLYPFKQRIENLMSLLETSGTASATYVRLLALDARLDEARRLIIRSSLEEAGIALDGVRSGIENVRRETGDTGGWTVSEKMSVLGKLEALDAREASLRQWLYASFKMRTGVGTDGSLPAGSATGTSALPEDAQPEFDSIELRIDSPDMEIGGKTGLSVIATKSNGETKDVSTTCRFVVNDPVVVLNGPMLTGVKAGSTTVRAYYSDRGEMREASATVRVSGNVKLERLIISSSNGESLASGSSTQLLVAAVYNNGEKKNVTSKTQFVLAAGGGSLNGSTFNAPRTISWYSDIVGSYEENGVKVVGLIHLVNISAE